MIIFRWSISTFLCVYYNMLSSMEWKFYKVKAGQTLREVATEFCVSEWKIVRENHLNSELWAGQILRIPAERGNAYIAGEESKDLLCGSEENYFKKNGTDILYSGMRVIL